jgi:hypothetical protein
LLKTESKQKGNIMSAKGVCDMSCGAMHEFALVLDKAGFNAGIVQKVVNSRGNKMAQAMYAALEEKTKTPAPPAEPTVNFELLADLGVIVVPDDYDHARCLAAFKEAHRIGFYCYNEDITDDHFPNPSRVLKPGDRLRVKAYKQVVRGDTTSVERMKYLKSQNMTVHVGAQGASLVYLQKKDELPKGLWYASFDEKERLWADAVGYHGVPYVEARSGGGFHFDLGCFERDWTQDDAFLGFCDEQPNSPLVA